MNIYIFDIDGTIADNSHRQGYVQQSPKDWATYNSLMHLDTPHLHICDLANIVHKTNVVVLCTGREEIYRKQTVDWLYENDVGYDFMLMRKVKDYRADEVVKKEMLDGLRKDSDNRIIMAFDDRDKVVAMWRANGVPCAQVAPGNF